MNRPRHETRTPVSVFLSLFLAAAIVACGGVLHAYYKNRQIQITREIKTIDRRVAQYRLDINITDMRMDQLLNRFAIRKQIEANGSSLRPIPVGIIEEIDAISLNRHSVASIAP
jgi:HAMP domain-containing protein